MVVLPKGPSSRLAALSEKRFGAHTFGKETRVTVTDTVTRLYTNDPNRLRVVVSNPDAATVYFSTSSEVTAGNGFILAGSGGVFVKDWETDGETVAYPIYAICPAGFSANVIIEEVLT